MMLNRRGFLAGSAMLAAGAWPTRGAWSAIQTSARPPAFSVVPVVGDGRWTWRQPPENETGYLEPRGYQLNIGVEIVGRGNASQVAATTPVPIACPEQKIVSETIDTQGCVAQVRTLAEGARQLALFAPGIAKGQTIRAVVKMQLSISKQ